MAGLFLFRMLVAPPVSRPNKPTYRYPRHGPPSVAADALKVVIAERRHRYDSGVTVVLVGAECFTAWLRFGRNIQRRRAEFRGAAMCSTCSRWSSCFRERGLDQNHRWRGSNG